MTHALLIALIVITLASDGLPFIPLAGEIGIVEVIVGTLAPFAVIAIVVHLLLLMAGRALDRTGERRVLGLVEVTLIVSRIAAVVWHGVAVLVLGWGAVIDRLIPVRVLVDEVIIILPALLVLVLGWVSYYPVERRLRDAALIRRIDQGEPIHPTPSRATYVLDQIRHQLGIILIPVTLILLWQETAAWWMEREYGTELAPLQEGILTVVNLAGVLLIIGLMPFVLRHLWDTVALGAGEMRDRLLQLCRDQGVGCRQVLLWRTHGLMLNGAVIGIVGRFRYILLTDALLERLSDEQVEAVMAHEVGHARFHHLPWLMLAMAESVLLTAIGMFYALEWSLGKLSVWPEEMEQVDVEGIITLLSLPPALIVALIVFGWISRRFERQADAFAVQHLSGRTRARRRDRGLSLSADAVMAMSSALGAVGRFNHIPMRRFTWRHGSLQGRRDQLHELVGVPAHAVPVDRTVHRVKVLLALGGAVLLWQLISALLQGAAI